MQVLLPPPPCSLCLKMSLSPKAASNQAFSWFWGSFFGFWWNAWTLAKKSHWYWTLHLPTCAHACCVVWACAFLLPWNRKKVLGVPWQLFTSSYHLSESGFILSSSNWPFLGLPVTNFICVQHPCHKFAFQVENSKYSSIVFYCSPK